MKLHSTISNHENESETGEIFEHNELQLIKPLPIEENENPSLLLWIT